MSGVPVPTTIEGWSVGSYGIWGLVILHLAAFTTVLVRNGPKWLDAWAANRRMASEDERAERTEAAAQIAAQKATEAADAAALGARVDALEERLTRMGSAMSFLMNAAITATNALPHDHPAVKQSRDLLALAASSIGNDDPFSKALSALATVKGVGE